MFLCMFFTFVNLAKQQKSLIEILLLWLWSHPLNTSLSQWIATKREILSVFFSLSSSNNKEIEDASKTVFSFFHFFIYSFILFHLNVTFTLSHCNTEVALLMIRCHLTLTWHANHALSLQMYQLSKMWKCDVKHNIKHNILLCKVYSLLTQYTAVINDV